MRRGDPLNASIQVMAGNASAAPGAAILPFIRPLSMLEIKLLWDVEKSLNALPLPADYRVIIDVTAERRQ